jgi:hypothetical protein
MSKTYRVEPEWRRDDHSSIKKPKKDLKRIRQRRANPRGHGFDVKSVG